MCLRVNFFGKFRFKVIIVNQEDLDDRKARPVAQHVIEPADQGLTIGNTGQRIGQCHLPDLLCLGHGRLHAAPDLPVIALKEDDDLLESIV